MILHYRCDRCEFSRDLRYFPRQYMLPDGRVLTMEQRHIWCAVCKDITIAEGFDREKATAEYHANALNELREFRDNPPPISEKTNRYLRERIENAATQLSELEKFLREQDDIWQEWRHLRTAGQKCLCCGNPDVFVPEDSTASLLHAGCGGTLNCLITVRSHNGPAYFAHMYSPDGLLLEVGKKPVHIPGQFGWAYAKTGVRVDFLK